MSFLSEEEKKIYSLIFDLFKNVHQHNLLPKRVIEHLNGYLEPRLTPTQIDSVKRKEEKA